MGCTNHPSVETGLAPCGACGRAFCGDCVVEFQGRTVCGPCKAAAVGRLEAGAAVALGGAEEPAPWERRAELGWIGAFVATVKAVMSEPTRFFARLDRTSERMDFLWFVVIVQVLVATSSAAVQIAMTGALFVATDQPANPLMAMMTGGFGLLGIALAPVGALVGAFVVGGLVHLALVVMKKATVPYLQTVRGYAYAQAPNVLGVIPIVGAIGGIWALVTTILMVKERHRCSGGVASISVLWVLAVGLCCVMVFVFGALGTLIASR